MIYEAFKSYFPELGEKETRFFTVTNDSNIGIPSDSYALVELYCNTPGCDCRRVMFNVYSFKLGKIVAVINYGWESESFYIKWYGENDREIIQDLKGPSLNKLSWQSKYASEILKIVSETILNDKAYIERLKNHYRLFKNKIDEKLLCERVKKAAVVSLNIGRNQFCPCGSRKKYKKCCGR